jgi:hypothetical protein
MGRADADVDANLIRSMNLHRHLHRRRHGPWFTDHFKFTLSPLSDAVKYQRSPQRVWKRLPFGRGILRAHTDPSIEKERLVRKLLLLIVAAAGLSELPKTQTLKTKPDLNAPAPRLPNGKPDFSGVWARPAAQDLTRTVTNSNGTSNRGEPNPLPFTTWGQAQWDNYDPVKNGDYAGSCMPFGWIRSFTPHPMQILQNDEYITFLFEQSTMFQVVNTEGLPHRKDWPPTWFGDSRGHWEGDKLVIEAVNFNGWTKLGTIGHPMSAQEIMEYSCMEGNLQSLLDHVITPWTGPKDQDVNILYGTQHDWPAYDLAREQKITGVIRQVDYRGKPPLMKLAASDKLWSVVLGPPPRMEFRGLSEQMLKPGVTASVAAYPSKQNKDEIRAATITIDGTTTELR